MDDKNLAEQMPQTIGRYQVQGSIGYGAMGAVYKAFDPLIKRTLAIKTIRLDIPRQSPQYKSFIERFYHEARISGTLSHPNIVTLFDIGEEGGIPYLAMEFVEGETISSLIDKGARFPPEKVIGLISQIASAVDYAHGKGVIHRDIKPSNLILFEGDRVKVTDFGIAKLVDAEMTQAGTLLGTPSYMSPEQAMGDKLDGRSDIFSLGVCAFEMLSGEQPFPGTNVTSILYKLVHVDPIEPANLEMNGLVPQKWHDVFGKVLAKRPDDRYQTATEFVQDLEYCLGSWFGSAMGDETVSEAAGATLGLSPAAAQSPDVTKSLPKVTIEPKAAPAPAPAPAAPAVEATTLLPAVGAAPPPPAAPAKTPAPPAKAPPPPAKAPAPPAKAPAPAEQEPDLPATVHMKVPAEGVVGATVMMSADQLPPTLNVKPAPAAAPPVGATVLMSAVDVTLPPQRPPEGTAKAPPSAPTVRAEVPPPTLRQPAMDDTVRKPVSAPARTPPPKPPAPPRPATPPPLPVTAPAPVPELTARAPRAGGPSAALILGGAAFVFLLAVLTAAVILMRHRGSPEASPVPSPTLVTQAAAPTPEPSPVVAPAVTGGVHVETQPPGATVTLNGESKGVTPLDVADLPLGIYELKVELKGHEPKTQSLGLTADSPRQELKLALTRLAPATGVADFLSTPFGASVIVDGAKVGQTPLTDFKLRVGSHQVELAKDGYESHAELLKVEAGKRSKVDAQLRAVAKAPPTPAPDVVNTNKVYSNSASDVDTLARKLSGSSASYPDSAPKLRSGEAASASVSFVVTENGEVTDLKVVESGGKMVDEAVMAAMRGWKYSPAVKKGVKVKVRITFKQTFRAG